MMIGQRLKQLRLARGMSLEDLAAEMGGVVTKQALSKYEVGKADPTPRVLTRLAAALGVKTPFLCSEPRFQIRFIAYRKRLSLPKKEQSKFENLIRHILEERLGLQKLLYGERSCDLPLSEFHVKTVEDAEDAAREVRKKWDLGRAPIANLTGVLEEHGVHVIEVATRRDLDGISAVASEHGKRAAGAAIATQADLPGERMRLNLAHELGHLVLQPSGNLDPEKAAFRFGAAFLAPAEEVCREVGKKRRFINLEEILLLKKRFGISIQAIIFRLHDLGIINDSLYKKCWMYINSVGWKRHEPDELPPERPEWLRRSVFRAVAEGLMTVKEGEALLGSSTGRKDPTSLIQRRVFMKLPLDERRRILAEQARKMLAHYEEDHERKQDQGGDFSDSYPS